MPAHALATGLRCRGLSETATGELTALATAFKLIITDEAHHATAEAHQTIYKHGSRLDIWALQPQPTGPMMTAFLMCSSQWLTNIRCGMR